MSLLNITNLTDTPEDWIRSKFICAFDELEKELEISIDETEKRDFIDNQISNLEEQADETLGKDLLGLIDNYLVNLDYYAEVKEWYKEKESKEVECGNCGRSANKSLIGINRCDRCANL